MKDFVTAKIVQYFTANSHARLFIGKNNKISEFFKNIALFEVNFCHSRNWNIKVIHTIFSWQRGKHFEEILKNEVFKNTE